MGGRISYVLRRVVFVVALALAGCGDKASQQKTPPNGQVEDAVRASLPPFLSLASIELEPIPTGPETVKVNFKANVTPREDLYQVDREVAGTPRVTLLKLAQATGSKASLYGSVQSSRMMDQWTLESPEIKTGLRQFGSPRGAFGAQSYVTGSAEANAALEEQAANAERIARAKQAALEQKERERKAREAREEQARIALEKQRKREMEERRKEEERRQKEEAAARIELVLATAPKTRYSGIVAQKDNRMRVILVFTEQKGFQVTAEVTSPDKRKEKQTFSGEILAKPVRDKRDGASYQLVLSPTGGSNWAATGDQFAWFFRGSEGSLKLRLTDTGLEGRAYSFLHYNLSVRLQREGALP